MIPGRLVAVALLAAGAVGCAGGPRPSAPPRPSGPPVPPWQIRAGEFATQRLFRAGYAGPQGDASFRITLKLFAQDRYLAQASDPLGRALWSLDVAGQEGVWADHRARVFCGFTGAFPAVGRELGAFPLPALPALLLGRLPVPPAEPATGLDPAAAKLDYQDVEGRRWTAEMAERAERAEVAAGDPATWTLWEDGTPSLWWMKRGGWAILSQRQRKVQLRWREVVREPLREVAAPPSAPPDYRRITCDEGSVGLLPAGQEDDGSGESVPLLAFEYTLSDGRPAYIIGFSQALAETISRPAASLLGPQS